MPMIYNNDKINRLSDIDMRMMNHHHSHVGDESSSLHYPRQQWPNIADSRHIHHFLIPAAKLSAVRPHACSTGRVAAAALGPRRCSVALRRRGSGLDSSEGALQQCSMAAAAQLQLHTTNSGKLCLSTTQEP
jgi:hypothetical protein